MNIEILRTRAKIVGAIRRFFDEQGFVEVETAVRIDAPAPEEHIDCPPVVGGGYLRASPELQMKKLLAAGMDKIYQIGPCFREGERGTRHNPEFTMIEWYRKNATYLDIKADLERLLASLGVSCLTSHVFAGGGGRETTDVRRGEGRETTDERPTFAEISVRDAYRRYAGWDPWVGGWDQDRFDFDMATKIEPAIKEMGGGVFLMDYPPQAASLAKLSEDSTSPITNRQPPTTNHQSPITNHQAPGTTSRAERWEFYFDGMELANCFTELCDRDEQLRRFEAAKEARKRLGESDYPIDIAFIDSLPQVKSAAGVALGVDRLVMVLTKTKEISAVRAQI